MMDYNQLSDKQKKRYDRILKHAESLIYQHGFYKLSLSELTQHLKISRSTIYENFGSKEGLVETIITRISKRLDEGLLEIYHNKTLSIFEKLIVIAQSQARLFGEYSIHKFLNDLKIHLPDLYERYETARRKREQTVYRPLIEQGIREGVFDSSLPADFLLQVYLKMAQLICDTDILEKSSLEKEKAMVALVKIFLKGTKNNKAASPARLKTLIEFNRLNPSNRRLQIHPGAANRSSIKLQGS